jgi:hypothetical protein
MGNDRPEQNIETESRSTTGGWVGLLRAVLTTAGPVAFLATILTGFLIMVVWGRFERIEGNQRVIMTDIAGAKVSMGAFVAQHAEIERERSILLQTQVGLLRQLCVNSAKSDYQTRACLVE